MHAKTFNKLGTHANYDKGTAFLVFQVRGQWSRSHLLYVDVKGQGHFLKLLLYLVNILQAEPRELRP